MRTYHIFPLSDQAVSLSFGNVISELYNSRVLAIRNWFGNNPFPGVLDLVTAYSSVTVFYDPVNVKKYCGDQTCVEFISERLEQAVRSVADEPMQKPTPIRVPVCYDAEFGLDLGSVCKLTHLSEEEVIKIHSGNIYRVYMIGFLPGFPYMGEMDTRLQVPRRPSPRQVVEAGGVGLAGRQTGIYPVNSPGGWQIIGQTPLRLFDKCKSPVSLLQAGDAVQFYRISKTDFLSLRATQP